MDRFCRRQLQRLLELRMWSGVHAPDCLRSSEIADWLGQAPQTVTRWRRELDFPKAAGTCRVPRMKGKGIGYWWRPADVLRWLQRTGRLVA